jgi:hypothetical protein
MLGRRSTIQHRQRDAGALHPIIPRGLWVAAAGCQGLLDQVEALVEPVAAETGIGGVFPDRLDPVGGPHHVLAANLEWAHPEQPPQFVDRAFDCERGL